MKGKRPARARTPRARPRPPSRAIVVHSLGQAEAAVRAAAALGVEVELWSAEGAAAYAGAGWFKAVVEEARLAAPKARFAAVLDCAELAGYALGALRIGLEAVCFTGPAAVAAKLADIAVQGGQRLLRRRPAHALDLRHADDPAALCRAWLGRGRAK